MTGHTGLKMEDIEKKERPFWGRREKPMQRMSTFHKAGIRVVFSVFVLVFVWSWHATCGAEDARPCAKEIATYCKEIKPGGGRLLNCIKEHKNDLSPACREKFASVEKQLKEAQEACSSDIDKFCKDIQPGEGRIIRCLREHAQEISPGCSEKIEGAKQLIPAGATFRQ